MVRPIDPSNPTSGDGNEKYGPPQKRGPGEFDKILEKEKAERARAELKEFIDKGPKSTPINYSDTGPKSGDKQSGFGGAGGASSGDFGSGVQKMNKDIKRNYKAGGKVSSASKRADGCCIKGKTKGKIV